MPNHLDDVLLHAMTGPSSPAFGRIQPTANIANCCATSSTTEQRVFWPWPLWQFFFPVASSVAHTDVASPACTVRLPAMLLPTSSSTIYSVDCLCAPAVAGRRAVVADHDSLDSVPRFAESDFPAAAST